MNQLAVHVDTTSAIPAYEQVRAQVADLVLGGHLTEGDRLPPVRQLAADLGLAVATVARAYRELESAGMVRSRRGAGTRITSPVHPGPAIDNQLAQAARTYVTTARQMGASDEQVLAAVRLTLTAAPQ
ncbi:GntR family transcriptional regulator [Streptomyces sp. NBC_01643]|uniref:GntR family transcriptional regulator n=1 Tax=Streptomyces sp. NBC_01643 TaxID=2975906 RepID=UPI002F90C41D|nr:GntR family transcriptional regulator [Streptomyces sp. NBC_01643]WTD39925.1 GntR family transcriptional regulator [Streptomyces sp. NBC_01643]